MMFQKKWRWAFVVLLLAVHHWLPAQPRPVLYWTFDSPGHPEWDNASDDFRHNFNVPANLTFLQSEIRNGGPRGTYVHKPIGDRGYSTRLQGWNYDIRNNFPSSPNPNGFTIEMLFRMGFPSNRFAFFTFFERVSVQIWSGGYQIGTHYETGTAETHGITLNGYDRMDQRYYTDGNWHHFATVYDWCEESNTGTLAIYVDGLTQPELTIDLPHRLRHDDLNTIYMNGISTIELNSDYDEVLVYDEAIDPGLIYQHFLDFQGGNGFCLNCPPVAPNLIPAVTPPTVMKRQTDFPVGYNLNGNNGPFPNSANIASIVDQTLEFPVPRYSPLTQMPRNHVYPGQLNQLAYDPNNSPETQVADLFDELYKSFHHTYFVSGLNNVTNSYTSEFVTRVNNSGGTITDLQAISVWPHVTYTSANGTDCMGAPYYGPYIHSPALPQSEYMVAVNPTPGMYPNPTYSLFAHSISSLVLSSFPDPRAISLTLNPSYATLDGNNLNANLQNLENQLNGTLIKYLVENGEEGPAILSWANYQQLIGAANYSVYYPNCSTDVGVSATATNNDIITDYHTNYLGGNPSLANAQNWADYQCQLKKDLRTAYYTALMGTAPGSGSNRQVMWYWNSGNSPFDYACMRDINASDVPTPANQAIYPTPYLYPQYPIRWFVGQGPLTGLKDVLLGRNEEIGAGDHYFTPAVSPGYDDGNFGLEDYQMLRPSQYLGLLKSLTMMGAENFESFQYNVQARRFHHSSMFGWMFSTPAYAQAPLSHVEPLFYNSRAMNGNFESFYNEGITSIGNGDYRFWGGEQNVLITAREGINAHVDDYLISGSIQNAVGENEYAANHPIYSDAPKFVTSNILGGSNPNLQFEVRKQGSTYFLDNSNPSDPIFVQLDKWHEDAHPDHWTEDFWMEAEVFDENVPNGMSVDFIPKTDGADFLPVTDGNFQNFTSYMRGSASFYQGQSGNANLGYLITPRNLTSQGNMDLWVRVRANGASSSAIYAELWDDQQGLIKVFNTTKVKSTCWTWVHLGNLNLTNLSPYMVKIFPWDDYLDVDQVAVLTGASHTALLNTVTPSLSASGYANASTVCQGSSAQITVNFTGQPPFSLHFMGDNGLEVYKNITSNVWTTTVYPAAPNFTYTIVQVTDRNCLMTVNQNIQIKANPFTPPIITQTGTFCPGGSVTLTSTSANNYLWSTGATTQSINVTEPGVYCVTVSNLGGCGPMTTCHQITPMEAVIFANPTLVTCGGGTVTVNADFGRSTGATYLWSNASTTPSINAGAGFHTVTITDNGCTDVVTVEVTTPRANIKQVQPVFTTSPAFNLQAAPGGGTWQIDLGAGFQTMNNAPNFNPATYGAGIFPIRYTTTVGSCQVVAETNVTVIEPCNTNTCPSFHPVILYSNHFPGCHDCPSDLSGTLTALAEDCTPNLDPNGNFAITNDDVPWGSGNSSSTTDHTGIAGSQYMLVSSNTTGTTTQIIHGVFPTDAGKRYMILFNAAAIQNTFQVKVYVDNTLVQTSNTLSPGSGWEQVCVDFQGTGAPTTIDVEFPAQNGGPTPYWVALDDLYFLETGPSIQVTGPSIIPSWGTANFSIVNPTPGVTYQWCLASNGTPGCPTGNSGPTFSTALVYQGPGQDIRTYRVSVDYGNGCLLYEDFTIEVVPIYNKTMEQDEKEEVKVMVFPNPNAGQFTLNLDLPSETDVQFALYDLMGRQILKGEIPNASGNLQRNLDISSQSLGVYLLKVNAGEFSKTIRVVRE